MKIQCRQCSGTGKQETHGLYRLSTIGCFACEGGGVIVEWEKADRCLSNSDLDSDPVCVSNIRVWRETHADSEDQLWRVKHGGYGSMWIEVRKGLTDLTSDSKVYKRAESLGLTGLTAVVDDLERLADYPILDEDDEGRAEQEEQEEHWENYGEHEVRRAVESAFESLGHEDYTIDMTPQDFSDLYYRTCHEIGRYPERIDSSAWDFGNEARYGRPGWILAPMVKALGF